MQTSLWTASEPLASKPASSGHDPRRRCSSHEPCIFTLSFCHAESSWCYLLSYFGFTQQRRSGEGGWFPLHSRMINKWIFRLNNKPRLHCRPNGQHWLLHWQFIVLGWLGERVLQHTLFYITAVISRNWVNVKVDIYALIYFC